MPRAQGQPSWRPVAECIKTLRVFRLPCRVVAEKPSSCMLSDKCHSVSLCLLGLHLWMKPDRCAIVRLEASCQTRQLPWHSGVLWLHLPVSQQAGHARETEEQSRLHPRAQCGEHSGWRKAQFPSQALFMHGVVLGQAATDMQ